MDFQQQSVPENPNNLAGEVTDTLGTDVFNPQNLKRINAIIGAISNMEYILPEHAIHKTKSSLDKIHLTFPQVPTMENKVENLIYHLTLFGGRFGKTGTEPPDEITNDDDISHMVEGGLSLKLRYEMMPSNNFVEYLPRLNKNVRKDNTSECCHVRN